MVYNLHLFKKGKIQKTIQEKVYMYGKNGKLLSCNVSSEYDELRLFDEDNRYIVTYKYVSSDNGKSVFKR